MFFMPFLTGHSLLPKKKKTTGISSTKWAIEYEEPAGEAFKLNHPESLMLINNCNVILRSVVALR